MIDALTHKKFASYRDFTLLSLAIFLASALFATPAHACTPPKSHYKNVSCTATAGTFLAVKDGGAPVALLNRAGNKLTDLFAYEQALGSQYRGGLLPVVKNGKLGYINTKGKTVIDFRYDTLGGGSWARGVSEKRIVVRRRGVWGVIDTAGKTIVAFDPTISQIDDYQGGKARVIKNGRTFYANAQGRLTPEAAPQTAQSTPTWQNTATPQPTYTPPTSDASWQQAWQAYNTASQASVNFTLLPNQQNGKWGFVDSRGVPMIQYVFDEVKPYSQGVAAVRLDNHWGFIDAAGDVVIDFRFHKDGFVVNDDTSEGGAWQPLVFRDGKAWIGNFNQGRLCVDLRGVNVPC
ncbi:hypothetical protein B0181_05240 [Moraxella caviae]|uniref:KWG Leptospira n=3 Tax=Moraxella caviae TaxID=34060 RepID=A0A1T0A3C9_9GAMM|nr:hypothetical protein B0181_05240 [Moraxella caviae]STZ14666.1 KWG Leptospira [Moraxella caviae]